jgi:hypothetical protein
MFRGMRGIRADICRPPQDESTESEDVCGANELRSRETQLMLRKDAPATRGMDHGPGAVNDVPPTNLRIIFIRAPRIRKFNDFQADVSGTRCRASSTCNRCCFMFVAPTPLPPCSRQEAATQQFSMGLGCGRAAGPDPPMPKHQTLSDSHLTYSSLEDGLFLFLSFVTSLILIRFV